MRKFLLMVPLALYVGGCSASVVAKDEYSITFNGIADGLINNMQETTALAQKHCAKYGKKASFQGIRVTGWDPYGNATRSARWDCRG